MPNEQNTPESPESRTGYGQTSYKRRLAYERLGVDPHDVQTAPFLRTNLRRIARCINQGRGERHVHAFNYLCSDKAGLLGRRNTRRLRWRSGQGRAAGQRLTQRRSHDLQAPEV